MENLNAGIDYGLGKTNIDTEKNIRFGVIQHNMVGQVWYDESEPIHPDNDGSEIDEMECFDCCDPLGFSYINDGYKCFQSYGDPDIFIEKSPYYTLCDFCSPCAPGAGYIMNQNKSGIKAYCFGHDFFEDNKAPYKVYSVKTNKEVKGVN